MVCTRCGGSGFLNIEQAPEALYSDIDAMLAWISKNEGTDVHVCDCCGNGEDWYGYPGEHYNNDDTRGMDGPYAYNGGYCECH